MNERITIQMTRDSICMADDVASHQRTFEIEAGTDVRQLIERLIAAYSDYTPNRWKVHFNGVEIGRVERGKISVADPMPAFEIKAESQVYLQKMRDHLR